MAVIAGADIRIELFISGAWVDLTCDTTSATWEWGAPEPMGPLTECEGGTLRVSMYDPDRKYDPDNPDSPLLGVVKVGLPMRVTVDAAPAWTGALQSWSWDRASMIADLNAFDPIGMLSMRALPERQTLAPVVATTASQAKFLLDVAEWDPAKRYFPDGDSGVYRGNHTVEGSALDGLMQIRFAELGRLYPLRNGGIGWHDRDGPTPPAPSAIINCGGVGLTDMWRALGLGRVRNRVVVSGGYGVYGDIRPPDEYRSVLGDWLFLHLAFPDANDPLPWDLWANHILDHLDHPPPLTVLGTIVPQGPEVKQIVCSEFGARWTVATPTDETVVELVGQRVTVEPGLIEVEAVTEDVSDVPPVKYALAGTGSGSLRSVGVTEPNTYEKARAGTEGVTVIGTGTPPAYYVGQSFLAGPRHEIDQAFLWFDTSSIPVGATILEAEFAAMILPPAINPPTTTWTNFTIELRSYPATGWRPTLAGADWRPGAAIAATYPLRATWNTANGINYQEFEDAGSGLAGAIVKGGETQLFAVSARTVAGTPPPTTTALETLYFQFPRLRVTYRLP